METVQHENEGLEFRKYCLDQILTGVHQISFESNEINKANVECADNRVFCFAYNPHVPPYKGGVQESAIYGSARVLE